MQGCIGLPWPPRLSDVWPLWGFFPLSGLAETGTSNSGTRSQNGSPFFAGPRGSYHGHEARRKKSARDVRSTRQRKELQNSNVSHRRDRKSTRLNSSHANISY